MIVALMILQTGCFCFWQVPINWFSVSFCLCLKCGCITELFQMKKTTTKKQFNLVTVKVFNPNKKHWTCKLLQIKICPLVMSVTAFYLLIAVCRIRIRCYFYPLRHFFFLKNFFFKTQLESKGCFSSLLL
jgi:hypothetical protein